MEDFFDRLDKYMKVSNLNDNQMTVKAGLSIGALGKQRKGSRGLSNESIAKILLSCSDLSAEWLLTGNGEMLKGPSNILGEPLCKYTPSPPPCKECKLKDTIIANQEREIASQAEFIKYLQENKSPVADGQKRKVV